MTPENTFFLSTTTHNSIVGRVLEFTDRMAESQNHTSALVVVDMQEDFCPPVCYSQDKSLG
jgi:hypothetical protein